MATPTFLSGYNSPYHFSNRVSHSRSLCSQHQLSFASLRGACRAIQCPVSGRGRGFKVVCNVQKVDVLTRNESDSRTLDEIRRQLSCVMKFGGSSVASSERMIEVADLILSFPEESPVIVLSAMGKTTNKLIAVCNFVLLSYLFHFVMLQTIFTFELWWLCDLGWGESCKLCFGCV